MLSTLWPEWPWTSFFTPLAPECCGFSLVPPSQLPFLKFFLSFFYHVFHKLYRHGNGFHQPEDSLCSSLTAYSIPRLNPSSLNFLNALVNLFVCMSVMFAYKSVNHVCGWCPKRREEGVGFPGTGVPDGCQLLGGFWELNLDPLQERSVLLTTDSPAFNIVLLMSLCIFMSHPSLLSEHPQGNGLPSLYLWY